MQAQCYMRPRKAQEPLPGHTRDGCHLEEAIFSALLAGKVCVACVSKDGCKILRFNRAVMFKV